MVATTLKRPERLQIGERLGLSKREAAALVPCSERFLELEIKAARLRVIKLGRKVVIRPGDLEAWLEARAAGGTGL